MKTGDICRLLDEQVPTALQESYDNSGIQTGSYNADATGALLTVDVTEAVLHEAVLAGCNMVISHHPMIFSPLKRITDTSVYQRTVMTAIKNNITVYSAHTNLDSVFGGVSFKMAEKMGLVNTAVLAPVKDKLVKLVTFIPDEYFEKVSDAIFKAGAGHIGNYDNCGYSVTGEGSFRGNEASEPFAGDKGEMHFESEKRFETVVPSFMVSRVIRALVSSHPYEEPAYDIYPLNNEWQFAGLGCIGILQTPLTGNEFLDLCKETFSPVCLRHTQVPESEIKKVALCGGSGFSLFGQAIAAGADAFVTADVKYHQFAEAAGELFLVDPGHYETEKFSVEIIYDLIIKKFPNFALRFSETITNPINCY